MTFLEQQKDNKNKGPETYDQMAFYKSATEAKIFFPEIL